MLIIKNASSSAGRSIVKPDLTKILGYQHIISLFVSETPARNEFHGLRILLLVFVFSLPNADLTCRSRMLIELMK